MSTTREQLLHYYKLSVAVSVIISVSVAALLISALRLRIEEIASYGFIAMGALVSTRTEDNGVKMIGKAISLVSGLASSLLTTSLVPIALGIMVAFGETIATHGDTRRMFSIALPENRDKTAMLMLASSLAGERWTIDYNKLQAYLEKRKIRATKLITLRESSESWAKYKVTIDCKIAISDQELKFKLMSHMSNLEEHGPARETDRDQLKQLVEKETSRIMRNIETLLGREKAAREIGSLYDGVMTSRKTKDALWKAVFEPEKVTSDECESLWSVVKKTLVIAW